MYLKRNISSMKKIVLLPFLLLLTIPMHGRSSAVTYTFSGGRFGDCLLAFAHAKYFAYINDIPLLYKPFLYSDQLVMHTLEQWLDDPKKYIKREVVVTKRKGINRKNERKGILYIIPYFPEDYNEVSTRQQFFHGIHFKADWDDPAFKEELKRFIAPRKKLKLITLPKNKICVAVHVRKGGNFDPATTPPLFPLKFPADSYYIEQISRITKLFPKTPIYVHIFTDDLNPGALAKKYQAAINSPFLEFGYRTEDNNDTNNVLEDFFSIRIIL
jgi:hypothetical protein